MSQQMINEFQDYLTGKGLRMTSQRELIARTFFQNKGHISTEEMYRQVTKTTPGIGFATTYRTMKLLTDAGLASLRSFGEGFTRYEPKLQREHHDHLICTRCGAIVEFEDNDIEAHQETIARKHGFRITNHKLELYGTCKKCSGRR